MKQRAVPLLVALVLTLGVVTLAQMAQPKAQVEPAPTQAVQATPLVVPSAPPAEPTPEAPSRDYTLTLLAEGLEYIGVGYPVAAMAGGNVTLSGERVDNPPGRFIGGTSMDIRGDYLLLHPATDGPGEWKSYAVLMDAEGNLPLPIWAYDDLYPLSDGGFLALTREGGDGGDYENRWMVLNADGSVARELPSTFGASDNDWYSYNEGLCPWRDEESGLVGYVDGDGAWVIPPQWSQGCRFENGRALVSLKSQSGVIDADGNYVVPLAPRELSRGWLSPDSDAPMRYRWSNWAYHNAHSGWIDDQGNAVPGPDTEWAYYQNGYFTDGTRYYDLSGAVCSENFDWCGGLNAQGQGFVGLDGGVYRIEFAK